MTDIQQPVKAPGNGTTKSQSKHVPQSRLYWEIRAEQTLNKVFDQYRVIDVPDGPKPFTDVEVIDFAPNNEKMPNESNLQGEDKPQTSPKPWLIVASSSLLAMLLVTTLQIARERQTLEQERNLQLITLLRQQPATAQVHGTPSMESNTASIPTPPSPPGEEWIQELAKLPPSVSTSPELLKVPLNGTLKTAPSQGSVLTNTLKTAGFNGTAMPQLVGIIQGNGSSGSAIFQWEGSSANARSGEVIGTSGWRLRTTNGDSVIIERGGQKQRLSLNSHG